MSILAIDTTSEWCSVAVLIDPKHYFFHHEKIGSAASGQIFGLIETVLSQAQLSLSQIDALAVSQGPGAFTGVRLGIGVAQGMAYGLNKPLIPIASLDGMVAFEQLTNPGQHFPTLFLAALDARMQQVYCAPYITDAHGISQRVGEIVLQDNVTNPEFAQDYLLHYQCAPYDAFMSNFSSAGSSTPHALGIAFLADQAYQAYQVPQDNQFPPIDQLLSIYAAQRCQPLYIRNKVAQTTKERQLVGRVGV